MEILEKVHWKTQLDWYDITYFFSKNKRAQLKRLERQFTDNNIIKSTKELDRETLQEFYILYSQEISKKKNSVIQDLVKKYKDELWKWILYINSLRTHTWTLIAWSITSYRNECYTLAFKASINDEELSFSPVIWIGNMLDYMVFNFWIDILKAIYISFWKDRNF